MRRLHRKTNPRVIGGVVQKKHRTELSPHYNTQYQRIPVIDRLRPGAGYRHLIRRPELIRFIQLLPDWNELSESLDAVVLAPGSEKCMGYYDDGVVAVCAWDREIAYETDLAFVKEHRWIIDRLGVTTEKRTRGSLYVHWTEGTAKAFQLLHILLHELGHHHDRMTTKPKERSSRGEGYAEKYANQYADTIWERYAVEFGW